MAKKGLRPTIPPTTPAPLVELLKKGMDADPEKRPTLREYHDALMAMKKSYDGSPEPWAKALLDGRAIARGEKTVADVTATPGP